MNEKNMDSKDEFASLVYYSERGMVNAICQSIQRYKTAGFHFLKKIQDINGQIVFKNERLKSIKSITLFNEFSLGDFGSPDLIVKVEYEGEKSILLFIEAKVGKYLDSVNGRSVFKDSYKNNASRINYQLRLRKRFVDAFYDHKKYNSKEIASKKDEYNGNNLDYKERYLKKPTIIDFMDNTVFKNVEKDNVYYVSMTSDSSKITINEDYLPFKQENSKLCFVFYENIVDQNNDRVLYGNTLKIFNDAYQLATDKNKWISFEKNGEED